jgi:hypothetical protein
MLIAMGLAVSALLSAPVLESAPFPSTPPTMIVTVAVVPAISPSLAARVLTEAGDIWQAAGFMLMWERQTAATTVSAASGPVARPSALHVTIGDERGTRSKDPYVVPLGWIMFEAESPQQEIYLSHANATMLLSASEGVVGRISTLTITERETLLGRAMGRALAHEIGHYLLASKAHSVKGVMQAKRGAAELFSRSRQGFHVDADQRRLIAARLNATAPIARAGLNRRRDLGHDDQRRTR